LFGQEAKICAENCFLDLIYKSGLIFQEIFSRLISPWDRSYDLRNAALNADLELNPGTKAMASMV